VPLLEVSVLLLGAERPYIERFDALLPFDQLRFGATLVADLVTVRSYSGPYRVRSVSLRCRCQTSQPTAASTSTATMIAMIVP